MRAGSERGASDLLVVGVLAVFSLAMTYSVEALKMRGLTRAWALLDDERASPAYCQTGEGVRVPGAAGESADAACLPPRLDHAPPGASPGTAPGALCLLAERLENGQARLPEDVACD